jgi:two-component system cell cycle sensor histidine kinase/response regulator CckA
LIVHELKVHQIELEMQNEELRRTQLELEHVKARYFDIYDLAPEGYLIVSEKGLIVESNLTAAKMLGQPRIKLINQRLTHYICKEDQDTYYN